MQDPPSSNIYGEKTAGYSVNFEVNIGYTLAALLGLYVAWQVFGGLSGSSDRDGESDPLTDEIEDVAGVDTA
jgi:hypothetical protein